MSSNISTLISFIKRAADGLEKEKSLKKQENDLAGAIDIELLEEAIKETLKAGVEKPFDNSEFEELVVINLILKSFDKGYSADKIRKMIVSLGDN